MRLQFQASALDQSLHASSLFSLQQYALDVGASEYGEVFAVADRFEEGGGSAPAAPVTDGYVVVADAFLLRAIEV